MFVLVLMTTSYAPKALLAPWLQTVAEINPVTQVLETARQGFVRAPSPGPTPGPASLPSPA